jgi:hypothetical protein
VVSENKLGEIAPGSQDAYATLIGDTHDTIGRLASIVLGMGNGVVSPGAQARDLEDAVDFQGGGNVF